MTRGAEVNRWLPEREQGARWGEELSRVDTVESEVLRAERAIFSAEMRATARGYPIYRLVLLSAICSGLSTEFLRLSGLRGDHACAAALSDSSISSLENTCWTSSS